MMPTQTVYLYNKVTEIKSNNDWYRNSQTT